MVQIESRKMDDESDKMLYWGSWEELVLGGAVLRHGTRSWDAVAAELRSRSFYPYFFTPEVCKARYQELQKRYSGCASACFEELRKQRVAELKRELERSDGSIGSLESKLESLKSEKNENRSGDYPSGQTESPPSVGNIARVDFPSKDTSKDGLSAGSFTEETQTDSSPASRILPTVTGIKAEEGENATSKENIVRKRRGKRKRKDVISEVGFRDKDLMRAVVKDESTQNSERAVRCLNDGDQTAREESVDLMSVLNSIIESENLSVFQRRTDSQRRGRYKKTIRRHMDLNLMKNGIMEGRITTARELYRDLLLLCNNGIVFYSKESREYKSAFSLGNYVRKNYWENIKVMNPCCQLPLRLSCPPPPPPLVVPKRAHSGGGPKVGKTVNEASTSQNRESKKGLGCATPTPTPVVEEEKKRVDKPVKVARSGGSKRVETPVNGKKKPRKR